MKINAFEGQSINLIDIILENNKEDEIIAQGNSIQDLIQFIEQYKQEHPEIEKIYCRTVYGFTSMYLSWSPEKLSSFLQNREISSWKAILDHHDDIEIVPTDEKFTKEKEDWNRGVDRYYASKRSGEYTGD